MRELRARLSGMALPTYVLDIPGGYAKVPLLSSRCRGTCAGRFRIKDHAGKWHPYCD